MQWGCDPEAGRSARIAVVGIASAARSPTGALGQRTGAPAPRSGDATGELPQAADNVRYGPATHLRRRRISGMRWLIAMLLLALTPAHAGLFTKNEPETRACEPQGVRLQALGSAGTEPIAGRAAASYLLWIDGKARVLVDAGAGTPLRLAEAGAGLADLDAVLFTHLRAEHTAGLPMLVQAAALGKRERALPVYGPAGDRATPSTVTGILSFPASLDGVSILDGATELILTIRNVDAAERIFTWQAQS